MRVGGRGLVCAGRSFAGAAGLVPFLLAGLAACGGGGGTDQPTPPHTPQFVLDPAGSSSNAGSLVLSVSADSIDASRSDVIEVEARVRDRLGVPLTGLTIIFQASMADAAFEPPLPEGIEPPQGGFPAGLALTDGSGSARIRLRAPGTPGQLAILASTLSGVGLGGIVFVEVFDSGFLPTPDDALVVIPERIDVRDPVAGLELDMVVLGGVPFPGATAGDPAPVQDAVAPYQILNGTSDIGTAELVFDGTYPAHIRYVVGGTGSGIHGFTVIDANPASEGVKVEVAVTFTPLEISPESATLIAFERQVFAFSGGVPPYECQATGGTLVPETITERGGTAEFTAFRPTSASSSSIVCTDQAEQVATAQLTISPPQPTPAPSPAPSPTPTAGAPALVPASATLQVGQAQTFAISGGTPPYAVSASGGTATPTTVPTSGGTFSYSATSAGVFTLIVTDAAGKVASASVTNSAP